MPGTARFDVDSLELMVPPGSDRRFAVLAEKLHGPVDQLRFVFKSHLGVSTEGVPALLGAF